MVPYTEGLQSDMNKHAWINVQYMQYMHAQVYIRSMLWNPLLYKIHNQNKRTINIIHSHGFPLAMWPSYTLWLWDTQTQDHISVGLKVRFSRVWWGHNLGLEPLQESMLCDCQTQWNFHQTCFEPLDAETTATFPPAPLFSKNSQAMPWEDESISIWNPWEAGKCPPQKKQVLISHERIILHIIHEKNLKHE